MASFQKEAEELMEGRRQKIAKYEDDPIKYARIHNQYAKKAQELRDKAESDWEIRDAAKKAVVYR